MATVREDKPGRVSCPYTECGEQSHPPGTEFCPYTGNRLSVPFPAQSSTAGGTDSNPFVVGLISTLKYYKYKDKRGWENFYVLDSLPDKIVKNAVKKCCITESECVKIPGIIDLTVRGTGNNCLVFGQKSIYCHNSRASHRPGTWAISYDDIKDAAIQPYGKFEIMVKISDQADFYINVAVLWNSRKKKKQLIEMLTAIGQLAKEHRTRKRVKKKKSNRRKR